MDKNGLIYTIIFCFVITFLFVFLLALANVSTQELVELNQRLVINKAVLNALGINYNQNSRDEIVERFEEVETLTWEEMTYYKTETSGENVYALRTQGPGLWGTIEVVIGFDETLNRYTGLEIIDQNETPGLGGRIAEEWFNEQFKGQAIPAAIMEGGNIALARPGVGAADDKDDNMVDAITGASRTSDSIQSIVSQAVRDMSAIIGGDN